MRGRLCNRYCHGPPPTTATRERTSICIGHPQAGERPLSGRTLQRIQCVLSARLTAPRLVAGARRNGHQAQPRHSCCNILSYNVLRLKEAEDSTTFAASVGPRISAEIFDSGESADGLTSILLPSSDFEFGPSHLDVTARRARPARCPSGVEQGADGPSCSQDFTRD